MMIDKFGAQKHATPYLMSNRTGLSMYGSTIWCYIYYDYFSAKTTNQTRPISLSNNLFFFSPFRFWQMRKFIFVSTSTRLKHEYKLQSHRACYQFVMR